MTWAACALVSSAGRALGRYRGTVSAVAYRRAVRQLTSNSLAILAIDHPCPWYSACITAQSSSHCIRPSCPAPGFDTATVAGGTVRS